MRIINDIECFKSGQIVPKRLGFALAGKAQHLIKFGADCEYDYKTKLLTITSQGCALVVNRTFTGSKKKGTKRNHKVVIYGLNVYSKSALYAYTPTTAGSYKL